MCDEEFIDIISFVFFTTSSMCYEAGRWNDM